jgi:hypothetical protein
MKSLSVTVIPILNYAGTLAPHRKGCVGCGCLARAHAPADYAMYPSAGCQPELVSPTTKSCPGTSFCTQTLVRVSVLGSQDASGIFQCQVDLTSTHDRQRPPEAWNARTGPVPTDWLPIGSGFCSYKQNLKQLRCWGQACEIEPRGRILFIEALP